MEIYCHRPETDFIRAGRGQEWAKSKGEEDRRVNIEGQARMLSREGGKWGWVSECHRRSQPLESFWNGLPYHEIEEKPDGQADDPIFIYLARGGSKQ